jgi:hypothetical protein
LLGRKFIIPKVPNPCPFEGTVKHREVQVRWKWIDLSTKWRMCLFLGWKGSIVAKWC